MQDDYPLVTIFSFVRNAARTIGRSVESVLSQDYPNFELVIQDGASDDGTVEIIQSYNDPRIKLVSEPDDGPNDAYMRLGPRLGGDIIGSCLADEELLPGAISWGVQMHRHNPGAGAVYGDIYLTDNDGNIKERQVSPEWDFKKYLFQHFSVPFVGTFFNGDLFRRFYDKMAFEAGETGIWLNIGARAPVLHVRHYVAKYAVDDKSVGRAQTRLDRFRGRMRVIEEFCDDPQTPEPLRKLKDQALCHLHTWLVCRSAVRSEWDNVEKYLKFVMDVTIESPLVPQIIERVSKKMMGFFNAGDFGQAFRFANMMTEAGIRVPNLYLVKGILLADRGEHDGAYECCRQELLANPGCAEARQLIEKILKLKGLTCEFQPQGGAVSASTASKDKAEAAAGQRKNVLVVSHERSGTHFLINSIAFNFPWYSNKEISITGTGQEQYEQYSEYFGRFERRIFKTHYQYETLRAFFERLLEHFHVFYIVRDGRDVLTSCLHYFNRTGPESFPQAADIGQLLKCRPADYQYDYKSEVRSENLAARWHFHVQNWLEVSDRITVIRYEDLHSDFEGQLGRIADVLGCDVPEDVVRPGLNDKSVQPRKGVVGDWRSHFTAADEEFFDRYAGGTMRQLGYCSGVSAESR